jgi:hypothetical protein
MTSYDLELIVHTVQQTGEPARVADVVIVPVEQYERLVALPAVHAAELQQVRDEHVGHLHRIEHNECVSTAFHRRVVAELRAKAAYRSDTE